MRKEQVVIVRVLTWGILAEDDFGDAVEVRNALVVGTPREGATVTLVTTHQVDGQRVRAFVEPAEKPARIATPADESGVQIISRHISEVLKAVG